MFAFAAEVSPAWDADSVLALFCAGSPFSSSAPAVTGPDTVAFMLLAVVCRMLRYSGSRACRGSSVGGGLDPMSLHSLPSPVLQISGETPRFAANPARVHAVTARDSITFAWLWCLEK